MSLKRQLKKELSELLELARRKQDSVFTCERTKKGNLRLICGNGDLYKLPVIPFRSYQLEAQDQLFIQNIKRLFLVRPRRAGKEVESWNLLIQGALTEPGLYLMIYPTNVRGRMILWDGSIVLPNGEALKFLDMIPKRFIAKKSESEMSIDFTNGSVIRIIGSDIDPERLRGVNPRGAVFSEYAFSDPRVMQVLMPAFRQNKGWFLLQTTYNGMNHAYRFMQEMKNNPAWFCRVDSALTLLDENGNRYITDEMIDEDRKSGMPEWLIQQEYFSKVEINQDTLYFAKEINYLDTNNKIIENGVIPNKSVYCFLDIGWDDCTAVTMAQLDQNGFPRVVNYFENRNRTFNFYVQESLSFCARHNLLLNTIFIPHDGEKRDFNTGKNTVDFGSELGQRVIVVPRPTSKINAIQSMRHMLYKTSFDKENTKRLIECLSNYSKEYDEKKNIYKEKPVHDWTSHGVDSFQTMTLAFDANLVSDKKFEISYYNT